MATLTPDQSAARRYLGLLGDDPDGVFTFQTFDDDKLRKDGRLARVFHGTLDDHAAALVQLQHQGAGVFVMVNEGDGEVHPGYKTCRTTASVVRVRMGFVDLDGAPLTPVLSWSLLPHIVVESSPEKWHCYWRVSDCKLDQFKAMQKRLLEKFDGDKSVVDLPRVLRLPGFFHQKGTPFMSRLVRPA